MDVTEVRLKIVETDPAVNRLRAFASITFDNCFVVHSLKVIEGERGLFVAMPCTARKDFCLECNGRNEYRARYCSKCGNFLGDGPDLMMSRQFMDVAHPTAQTCRDAIQRAVLGAYYNEKQTPGSELPLYEKDIE